MPTPAPLAGSSQHGRAACLPTSAQRRLLRAIATCEPADGWGEVFTHYDARGDRDDNPARSLIMRNFDATANACKARGWIVVDLDGAEGIALTDAGRAALAFMHGVG